MAPSPLIDLQSLMDRLAPGLAGDPQIVCKRFFGGAAAYVDARIFVSLTPVGLTLKLSMSF